MAAALSDAQLANVEATISAHPEILQAFKAYQAWASPRGRLAYVQKGGPPNPQQVLQQYGIDFPDLSDYQIQMDPSGQVKLKRENWFRRNADWILPVSTIGGGAVANFAMAGAPVATTAPSATTGGTTVGGTEAGLLPSTSTVSPVGSLAPAVTPSTNIAAGTTTATGMGTGVASKVGSTSSTSVLHDLLPSIIGAGSTVGGAAIAAHANTEAAKIAAEQADKAMAIQKEQYALQREDTAPYRALGQGAVGNLGYLSGIDVAGTAPALASTVPKQPYGTLAPTQAPTLESGGTNTGIQTGQHSVLVPVKNPQTGLIHLVPNNELSAAIAAGGQVTR